MVNDETKLAITITGLFEFHANHQAWKGTNFGCTVHIASCIYPRSTPNTTPSCRWPKGWGDKSYSQLGSRNPSLVTRKCLVSGWDVTLEPRSAMPHPC